MRGELPGLLPQRFLPFLPLLTPLVQCSSSARVKTVVVALCCWQVLVTDIPEAKKAAVQKLLDEYKIAHTPERRPLLCRMVGRFSRSVGQRVVSHSASPYHQLGVNGKWGPRVDVRMLVA